MDIGEEPDGTAFEPDVSLWNPWRPEEAARRFAGVRAPWYVAGGWAIDLFLGGQRREHDDLEIAVPRHRFHEFLPALADCELVIVGSGSAWPLAEIDRAAAEHHQTWVRERSTGFWRLDIFREPGDVGSWISRRDDRLRLPYDELILHTGAGIPYGRPEVILLYKAKASRPKDEDDFSAALPQLTAAGRRWLANALELVHPGHPWLAALARRHSS